MSLSVLSSNNRSDRTQSPNKNGSSENVADPGAASDFDDGTEVCAASFSAIFPPSTPNTASSVKLWVSALPDNETDSSPSVEMFLSPTSMTSGEGTGTLRPLPDDLHNNGTSHTQTDTNTKTNSQTNSQTHNSTVDDGATPEPIVDSILPPVTDELRTQYSHFLQAKQALASGNRNASASANDGERSRSVGEVRGHNKTARSICCCLVCGVPALLWFCLIGFAIVTVVYAVITAVGLPEDDVPLVRPPYGSPVPKAVPTLAPTVLPASG